MPWYLAAAATVIAPLTNRPSSRPLRRVGATRPSLGRMPRPAALPCTLPADRRTFKPCCVSNDYRPSFEDISYQTASSTMTVRRGPTERLSRRHAERWRDSSMPSCPLGRRSGRIWRRKVWTKWRYDTGCIRRRTKSNCLMEMNQP